MTPDEFFEEFKRNFGKLIQEDIGRFTQQEIADRLEVSQTTISQWKTGNYTPTLLNLLTVAKDQDKPLWLLLKELSGESKAETRPDFLAKVSHAIKTMSDRELTTISHKMMEEITSRLIGN